jgi:SpoVK/Ycf46/Vps4 family AAA+-type ATPase
MPTDFFSLSITPDEIKYETVPEPPSTLLTVKNLTIDSVVLVEETKEEIRAALSQIKYHQKIWQEWGLAETLEKGKAISLLFYGGPGTGKTLMGQAIANDLNYQIKIIQTAEIESSEPGQAERNLKAYFESSNAKTVLLFDECDSLIAPRDEVGMILGAQINCLLSSLELFEGVVIFTTNRLGRMDEAFERRVSIKIEFPFPNQAQRQQIWKRLLPPAAQARNVDLGELAKYPLTGGHIKNIILTAARHAAYRQAKKIEQTDFLVAIKRELTGIQAFAESSDGQPKLPQPREYSLTASRSLVIEKEARKKGETHR